MSTEILIIDDNADIRNIINDLIIEAGYKTRLAANYNQALSEIDKKLPDVAIIDVKLDKGDNDGLELLSHIKTKDKNIPVIIITGHANVEMAIKALKAGAFEFIEKPFSKEKIFDASFWIFISAIFHFWSILYIILVFISIIFHSGKEYKNWLLPFISFLCVWVLYIATSLLMFDSYSINKAVFHVSFNFFDFKNVYQNMALALFVSIAVLFFASQTIDYQNKPLNMQSSYKQVYFAFLLAVGIYVFSTNKSNYLLIYTFAPLAILGANMFEKMKNSIYKEVSLYLLLGVGLFFFFVQL